MLIRSRREFLRDAIRSVSAIGALGAMTKFGEMNALAAGPGQPLAQGPRAHRAGVGAEGDGDPRQAVGADPVIGPDGLDDAGQHHVVGGTRVRPGPPRPGGPEVDPGHRGGRPVVPRNRPPGCGPYVGCHDTPMRPP